jgi:DNA repair protein RecN (Recombination protein N)
MLSSLHIKDFVIIDKLTVDFNEGFTAVTGETGAGKSILLDALFLVLGGRADLKQIKNRCEQAVIIAEFDYAKNQNKEDIEKLLDNNGIHRANDHLILKRIIHNANRSKIYINDEPATVGLLSEVGGLLFEAQEQFDRLLTPESYLKIVDDYVMSDQLKPLKEQTRSEFLKIKALQESYDQAQRNIQIFAQKKILYQSIYNDMKGLNFDHLNTKLLNEERQSIEKSGRIGAILEQTLTDYEKSSFLSTSLHFEKSLERQGITKDHPLTQGVRDLIAAYENLVETIKDEKLNSLGATSRLLEIDDRLHLYRGLSKKYLVPEEQLESLYNEAKAALEHGDPEGELQILEKEINAQKSIFLDTARKLSAQRKENAKKLTQAINREVANLKLVGTTFDIVFNEKDVNQSNETGIDDVCFLFSANNGGVLNPLHKVASGGELARIILSIKVAIAQHQRTSVLVFDEIDIGVGGGVAAAIGERMRHLANNTQIISITHSPQVAAKAHHHLFIQKQQLENNVMTVLTHLTPDDRENEIARMLSGSRITEEARSAARVLLS